MKQQTLEGFPPDTLQQIRRQSAQLERLQHQAVSTPARQQELKQLQRSLRQFENDVIRVASRLEQQEDWHGAEQIFDGAIRVLPESQPLISAQRELAERRQLHEARVRMELEIHRGEQLQKDVAAYERLKQLQGPDFLTWLELKNFHRQRRASAQALQQHAQLALERGDYVLAHRALTIAQDLYGIDLEQDNSQREQLDRDLKLANSHLRPAKRQPERRPQKSEAPLPVEALKDALDAGDLLSARQHLNQLEQRSPQHPQLQPLQTKFHTQVTNRVQAAIKRGNDLYSQGHIERALAVWREAKPLDPENVQLLANIARAEKVLRNLRALSAPAGSEPQAAERQ
ncbi:hypothetical protein ACNKU7_05520 [Microbulbifer sp. SA54]|uniref:hypothetical protein n=1 Tax=Microbulbifer sp. SA54 TaxID=3401577 RepID=UPI003AAFDCBF